MSVSQKDWQEATAEEINLKELDALVDESVKAWADSDAKKKIYTEAYHKAEKVDMKILSLLNRAKKSKYFVDGLGTMIVVRTEVVTTPKTIEAKKEFFKYLRDISDDVFYALVSVASPTLNSWYKQKVEEAQNAGKLLGFQVPGIEAPTTRETLSFRKDKKGTNEQSNKENQG